MRHDDLRISEIFYSLQGESKSVGRPTVFIRLTGCPLRCQYCDTSYAFSGGEMTSIANIMAQVAQYKTQYITVTGGEPLAQPACLELLKQLADKEYIVSLETSGALDISQVDSRVVKVVDLKTPASAEEARNLYTNLPHLDAKDQLKFVICNAQDYVWSKEKLDEYQLDRQCEVLFSPSMGEQDPTELAEWILRDQLPVRFQLQLHKILWGNSPGK
ncbi:7-carboxy-7-deazaguanine synthase QueE [methanotrophic endosymbiont of Bathymodiolus puteoserpentis (Logatchev)]|uniref:7-carboxy-7-deazaguanine synthase QueE n=1 Tax=methanotrophic endosymbiont of Bathymodiolus puteoserpentis (Logatchev) TaxID=343235 RepID=UPI0013C6870D|nr:7-carboxy-7-deazaguanine synthase QueE [methanotrophic endosymbiont of Bathymodiolus puteoserpentis (Logatchev)]SHE22381.1 Queuosine Biosynthesis QueE Radical SAM [methanotrophic endosymbiont of Bathymodiolus puteoserpentis (Logatchev)]